MEREAIGILGAGWVGTVTAACFAELGHDVVVRDVNSARIEALSAGPASNLTGPASTSSDA